MEGGGARVHMEQVEGLRSMVAERLAPLHACRRSSSSRSP